MKIFGRIGSSLVVALLLLLEIYKPGMIAASSSPRRRQRRAVLSALSNQPKEEQEDHIQGRRLAQNHGHGHGHGHATLNTIIHNSLKYHCRVVVIGGGNVVLRFSGDRGRTENIIRNGSVIHTLHREHKQMRKEFLVKGGDVEGATSGNVYSVRVRGNGWKTYPQYDEFPCTGVDAPTIAPNQAPVPTEAPFTPTIPEEIVDYTCTATILQGSSNVQLTFSGKRGLTENIFQDDQFLQSLDMTSTPAEIVIENAAASASSFFVRVRGNGHPTNPDYDEYPCLMTTFRPTAAPTLAPIAPHLDFECTITELDGEDTGSVVLHFEGHRARKELVLRDGNVIHTFHQEHGHKTTALDDLLVEGESGDARTSTYEVRLTGNGYPNRPGYATATCTLETNPDIVHAKPAPKALDYFCTATLVGGDDVQLTVSGSRGTSENVIQDGTFLDTLSPTDTELVVPGGAQSTFLMRVRGNGHPTGDTFDEYTCVNHFSFSPTPGPTPFPTVSPTPLPTPGSTHDLNFACTVTELSGADTGKVVLHFQGRRGRTENVLMNNTVIHTFHIGHSPVSSKFQKQLLVQGEDGDDVRSSTFAVDVSGHGYGKNGKSTHVTCKKVSGTTTTKPEPTLSYTCTVVPIGNDVQLMVSGHRGRHENVFQDGKFVQELNKRQHELTIEGGAGSSYFVRVHGGGHPGGGKFDEYPCLDTTFAPSPAPTPFPTPSPTPDPTSSVSILLDYSCYVTATEGDDESSACGAILHFQGRRGQYENILQDGHGLHTFHHQHGNPGDIPRKLCVQGTGAADSMFVVQLYGNGYPSGWSTTCPKRGAPPSSVTPPTPILAYYCTETHIQGTTNVQLTLSGKRGESEYVLQNGSFLMPLNMSIVPSEVMIDGGVGSTFAMRVRRGADADDYDDHPCIEDTFAPSPAPTPAPATPSTNTQTTATSTSNNNLSDDPVAVGALVGGLTFGMFVAIICGCVLFRYESCRYNMKQSDGPYGNGDAGFGDDEIVGTSSLAYKSERSKSQSGGVGFTAATSGGEEAKVV